MAREDLGEAYTSTSLCYQSLATHTSFEPLSEPEPACFPTAWAADGRLMVKCVSSWNERAWNQAVLSRRIGSDWYSCPESGSFTAEGSGYIGAVQCPQSLAMMRQLDGECDGYSGELSSDARDCTGAATTGDFCRFESIEPSSGTSLGGTMVCLVYPCADR